MKPLPPMTPTRVCCTVTRLPRCFAEGRHELWRHPRSGSITPPLPAQARHEANRMRIAYVSVARGDDIGGARVHVPRSRHRDASGGARGRGDRGWRGSAERAAGAAGHPVLFRAGADPRTASLARSAGLPPAEKNAGAAAAGPRLDPLLQGRLAWAAGRQSAWRPGPVHGSRMGIHGRGLGASPASLRGRRSGRRRLWPTASSR